MKIVEEQLLFECLEQFEAGVPLATLLAQHPHAAAEIEKFLAVFVHLQQLPLQPSLAAKRQSQKLFLQQAAQLSAEARQTRFSWRSVQRTLLPLAALATFVVLFGFTLLFASASALPGDALYGAKLLVESYQVEQAGDATAVFSLNHQLNEERVREVKALLRTNQTAELSFEGRLNTRQGSNWIIAGVPVAVSDQTQVEGYAVIGALVLVNGRAANGHFVASRIVVLEDGPATATTPPATTTAVATGTTTPSPTVTPTSSVTPTLTVTATASATPQASGTPDGSSTPTATLTNTPTGELPTGTATPTATAVPPTAIPPTATPQPTTVVNDDNNNDNAGGGGNDNDNDNDGDNDNNGDNGNDNSGGGNDNNNDNDGDNNNDNDNDNGRRDD